MCRHYFFDEEPELYEAISQMNRGAAVTAPQEILRGEFSLSSTALTIANNKAMTPTLFAMRWGYAQFGSRSVLINARSETATEKPTFREGMALRRCLVPASRYFEYKRSNKTRYAIAADDGKPMYFAGIYRFEQEQRLPAFVILTRPPAPSIEFIHDRMPLVVPYDMREEWLKLGGDTQAVINSASENVRFWKES